MRSPQKNLVKGGDNPSIGPPPLLGCVLFRLGWGGAGLTVTNQPELHCVGVRVVLITIVKVSECLPRSKYAGKRENCWE